MVPKDWPSTSTGNVYIADTQNHKIRKIGATITTIAGTGTAGFSGDGSAAASAQLNLPTGVAVDAAGNVYVAEFGNNRVRKISTTGTITTIAGNGNAGFSGDGGAATSAMLKTPQGVAVDTAGNVYIAEPATIGFAWSTGTTIRTFAGNGSQVTIAMAVAATATAGRNPVAVAVDAAGSVYIADGSGRVRKVLRERSDRDGRRDGRSRLLRRRR